MTTQTTQTSSMPPAGRKPPVWLIADAHLGHRAIGKYRVGVSDSEDNTDQIVRWWRGAIAPTAHVWMLGDMAFTEEAKAILHDLPGIKHWVLGNHDVDPSGFRSYGLIRKYRAWLSHAPMHPAELRGHPNVHGHVHLETVDDPRYFNISADNTLGLFGQWAITLDQLRWWMASRDLRFD